MFLVDLLLKNWKAIVVGLVIIGCLGYVENLRVVNAEQATKIVQLTDDNATLTTNVAVLQQAITETNATLDASDKAAKASAKKFADLQTATNQQTAALQHQLDFILHEKDPVTCNDSIIFLIDGVKGFSK